MICVLVFIKVNSTFLFTIQEDFSFDVILYPFLDGNIPTALSYGVFTSQLVRFVNINSSFKGFIHDVVGLVRKLVSQGFDLAALRKKFVIFYERKLDLWSKYGVDIFEDMINVFKN